MKKNPHAQALGALGGKANTPAQNKARAKNAKKGGWPKGMPRKTAVARWTKVKKKGSK